MSGKHIGYIRVSTPDQTLDRQLDGVTLEKTFRDKASGKSSANRSGLMACLEYLRDGDVLHVHSIDRLARNLLELQEIVSKLVARGVSVQFHKENLYFGVDSTANPCQELMLQMLGAFAQFELAMIRERQKEGIVAAKKNGVKFGRPKLNQEKVEEIKSRLAMGDSVTAIAKTLQISRRTVYNYARQKDYCAA